MKKMNMSIRKQLTLIFISLIVAMFLANYLANTFFLEDFYYQEKQQVLVDTYELLNENLSSDGQVDDETVQEIEEICNANNLSFIITDQYYNLVLWTKTESSETPALMSDYVRLMQGRLNGYRIGVDVVDEDAILQQNDNYTIQKKYEPELTSDFLEMWGVLDQDFYFFMRINMESIRESVRISNEFIKYICIIGVLLAVVFVWLISRKVTKPLNELTKLSKQMAELNFEAKYTSGGRNEIGQLGEHFNQMSENLERTYSQLMTANNELKRDIEKKQQVDNMRKEFLSNVSHELKTPLALIQGYAEGLQECISDDPESREFYCEVIIDEAAKMTGLVQKLMTLNQLEFGNDEVVMERFDLAVLVQNKIQSVAILAQQKEAEITYHGPKSVYVWGDEFKIEEVITNYLSNALNHVDGERRIEIEIARQEEPDGNQFRVSVFNTGQPIPEEDIGRIWEKFYKVDKARTREYGGSGVGLSIVKAIMDSMHQPFGVENLENGVVFWFELSGGNNALLQGPEPEEGAPEAEDDPGQPLDGAWKPADDDTQEPIDGIWKPADDADAPAEDTQETAESADVSADSGRETAADTCSLASPGQELPAGAAAVPECTTPENTTEDGEK